MFAIPWRQEAALIASCIRSDLGALMSDGAPLHADMTLVGSDGVSVLMHGAMLRARCPRIADRAAPPQRAAKRARTAKSARGDGVDSPASIVVSEAEGSTLRRLAQFLYTDVLPPAWSTEGADDNRVLSEAISLMTTARDLCPLWTRSSSSSSLSLSAENFTAGAPLMRRLQALCEAHVASLITVANVHLALPRLLDGDSVYLQHVCYQLLSREKPFANLQFNGQLISAISAHPQAQAISMAAASGLYQPSQPTGPIELPVSTFVADMHLFLAHANSAQAASEPAEDSTCSLAPDCYLVSGALSFGAHRFILAARSDYFKAAFCSSGSGGGFSEGSSATLTLQFPEPAPSAAAIRAMLCFVYTGGLLSSVEASLSSDDALDLLVLTGSADDESGGYFGLHESERLRQQAHRVLLDGLADIPLGALPLLRKTVALGQAETKKAIMARIASSEFLVRALIDSILQEQIYEEWWSKDGELELRTELLVQLARARW